MEMNGISILIVSHSYPPVLGGSEVEGQRVAALLRARGHRVRVICAANPEMTWHGEGSDEAGTPVRVEGWGKGRILDWSFALCVFWRMWVERGNYDVVYFLMQGVHVVTGLAAGRMMGKAMVMKISGSGLIPPMRRSLLGRLQLQWLERWGSALMLLNEGMMAEAREAGISPGKMVWMPNPVDCEEFRPLAGEEERRQLKARLGMEADQLYVVFVGRLSPEKELGSLLGGMKILAGRMAGVRLLIVGDGPQREMLEQRVKEEGLAVDFAGRQPMNRVREYMQAADVFALVSRLEGFPCSLVEAMACGLPALVSRIPANEQLIEEGKEGHFFEVRDEEQLALGLERMLQNKAASWAMGQAGRERVRSNFDYLSTARRYEELLGGAIEAKKKAWK
jgi:glycosyltransferase involved in cell wall biosynthesis